MGSRVRVLTYPVEVDDDEEVVIVAPEDHVSRWKERRYRAGAVDNWRVVSLRGRLAGMHTARIVVDCTGLDATIVATEFARYTDWLAYIVLPMLLPSADAHLDICGSDPDLLGTLAHYAKAELAATVERAPVKADPKPPRRVDEMEGGGGFAVKVARCTYRDPKGAPTRCVRPADHDGGHRFDFGPKTWDHEGEGNGPEAQACLAATDDSASVQASKPPLGTAAMLAMLACPPPVPMLLWCPTCGDRHVDEGAFATKEHHTHACQNCGMVWRPALVPTVGVRFLPGFKDGDGGSVAAARGGQHVTPNGAENPGDATTVIYRICRGKDA